MNPKAIETSDYVEGQFAAAKARNDARTVDRMTIREAFAMAAMQGFVSSGNPMGSWTTLAADAVRLADVLIEALHNSQAEGIVEKTDG